MAVASLTVAPTEWAHKRQTSWLVRSKARPYPNQAVKKLFSHPLHFTGNYLQFIN
ncbi:hypothetical protein [Lactobacillus sp. 3B(2020)]|uniref:hypothetical protein n=1 Tax=Lactobacillus sp. 3B(2020) TaxID=2695882 RepID=UPI001C60B98C|nr:hypothetical protein [Lactobacillus sp. 3B(2020)]